MSAPAVGADPVQRVLDVLDGARRSGPDWMALCPAHEDRNASLSVKRGDNGNALLKCHAGCETEDVVAALDLTMADLFADRKDRPKDWWRVSDRPLSGGAQRPPLKPVPDSAPQPRAAGREPLGPVVARYDYRDESGRVLFTKTRHEPKTFRVGRPDGSRSIGDAPRVLYRLPELLAAVRAGQQVYVVEGEKDADRLAELGIAATCNYDGAGKWAPEYNDALDSADVVIVADRDIAGYRHALIVWRNLSRRAASVRVTRPRTDGQHDDVSDHLDAGHRLDELAPVGLDELHGLAGEDPPAGQRSDDDDAPRTTGWERTDLAAILDGGYQPPQPGILHRTDGVGLFYAGLLHQVIGQPESGKSWLALLACVARLQAGERVLYLDYESDPAQIVTRLLALGATRAQVLDLFDYRRPETGVGEAWEAFAELLGTPYALVVVDGVTDALGTNGASMLDNDEVGRWIRDVPERIARKTGAAVVLIDHVAKGGSGGPSRYAVGAQQKLGKIRGTSYYVEPRTPIAPGQVGELTVIGTKDTAGQVKRHGARLEREPRLWAAARVQIDATDPDHLDVEIRPPFDMDAVTAAMEVGERGALYERDTVLMERVSRVLETADEEMTARAAADRAKGKRERLYKALQALVREGFVSQRAVGVAQLHGSLSPFREAEDAGAPAPDSTPPRAAEIAPEVSADALDGLPDDDVIVPSS